MPPEKHVQTYKLPLKLAQSKGGEWFLEDADEVNLTSIEDDCQGLRDLVHAANHAPRLAEALRKTLDDVKRLVALAGRPDRGVEGMLANRMAVARILRSADERVTTTLAAYDAPTPTVDALIEASSFGTPEARAARARTPPGVVQEIVRRSEEIRTNDCRCGHAEDSHAHVPYKMNRRCYFCACELFRPAPTPTEER